MRTLSKGIAVKLAGAMTGGMLLIVLSSGCFAIDNPDAPDYLGQFQAQAEKYEAALDDSSDNARAYTDASGRYEKFLDTELNTAYRNLQNKLDAPEKEKLLKAQKAWLAYRDTEFSFIVENWNQQNFGSSSLLSRTMYRASIVRNRVEQLLSYLKNY